MSVYRTHWGFCDTPFRDCHDPHLFYQSPTHEEALARLHFLVEQNRRLGLLMGPAGSGKSLLLEVFAARLRRTGVPVALANLVGLGALELLWQIALGLGLNPCRVDSQAFLWRRLMDRLAEFRYREMATVVLLDDVDQAEREVLGQITRLANFDRAPQSRLTMVIAARHEQVGRVGHALLELADLRIDLEPWEAVDTEQYIRSSLRRVGCLEPVFASSAVERLHELSGGVPRRVAQLADLALLAAAGRDQRQVDVEVVESAFFELGCIVPA